MIGLVRSWHIFMLSVVLCFYNENVISCFHASLCKCKIFLYIMRNLFQFIHKICSNSAVSNCYYWCFSLTAFLLSCRLWKQLFGLLTAIANEVSERYLEDIGCCKACINSLSLIWFQCARVFLTDSERFT